MGEWRRMVEVEVGGQASSAQQARSGKVESRDRPVAHRLLELRVKLEPPSRPRTAHADRATAGTAAATTAAAATTTAPAAAAPRTRAELREQQARVHREHAKRDEDVVCNRQSSRATMHGCVAVTSS